MPDLGQPQCKILIVDDEWESAILRAVRRKLEDEGWSSVVLEREAELLSGDEFESAETYRMEPQV